MKRLTFLAVLLCTTPAWAAGAWSPGSIPAGSCSTFTWASTDAADAQPPLLVLAGELAITAEVTSGTPSVAFYLIKGANGSDTPASTGTLAYTATATSRSPTYVSTGGGYVLDPDIDTAGAAGGTVTVCSAGYANAGRRKLVPAIPGSIWLRGTGLDDLAWLTQSRVEPLLGTTGKGFESCFYDFTSASEFTITPPASLTIATGAVDNNGGEPVLLTLATEIATEVTPNTAPANNTPFFYEWGQTHVGVPDNYFFTSDRANGASNRLMSSLKFGVDTNATGQTFYNPFCGFGVSSGTANREVRATWRVRRTAGTATNSCLFVGFVNSVIADDNPLTTTCTLATSATARYFGLAVLATTDVRIVVNELNTGQLNVSSGLTPNFGPYVTIEMVMVWSGTGSWGAGSYVDFYVDGVLAAQAGRVHSIEQSDLPTFGDTATPFSIGVSTVRLTATGGAPTYDADYIGFGVTRQ